VNGRLGLLATVIRLRFLLWSRTLEKRPRIEQLASRAAPPIMVAVYLGLFVNLRRLAADIDPELIVTGSAFGLVVLHLPLLVSVVRRAAEGEGGAAALILFPVPASVLHTVETLAGIGTIIVVLPGVVLAGALAGSSNVVVAVLWGGVLMAYLAGIRQLTRLLLAGILRHRWLREVVLAGASLAGLVAWFGVFLYSDELSRAVTLALSGDLPELFWWLPVQWFVLPAAGAIEGVPPGARLAGWIGAPLLVLAVLVAGAQVQRSVLLGEATGRRTRSTGRRLRWGLLLDRAPLSWVPGSIWAIAGKELKLLSRNPFFVVMLLGQLVLWIALPFLYAAMGVKVAGGDTPTWLPFVALFSLLGMQSFTFNQLGSEGRGMHFLAGSPVPRMHILLGKNIAYAAIGGPVAALSVGVAAVVFDEPGAVWFILAAEVGVVLMLGVGNLVSVLLPRALLGGRGVSGGSRAAQVAAAGALPPSGCLVSVVSAIAVAGLATLMIPVVAGVALAAWKGGTWPAAVLPGVLAYALLVWLALTTVASIRLTLAEAWILSQIAGKEAS
jgi:hypothetical protein